ncbi:putative Longin-like domain superfamily, AP complex, mu/sigma subunit protein [Helianthus annuus]|uniref:Longin-like domain superfamily, AP complex, mu/sigma subunit protein n=1 Tax=Helianthus annuus TaxID=4232 RepID=A0A9K3MWZ5_HELAN|nr:putative Longin-like domain superfamily, AP complex, mu/sigma subunit protein [Helianthus annuus]KAJ0863559.1 putative Longin-like domain superfamily, AP complex, mu/sigma subunit protein [Helianthus annuus]
MIRAVIVTNDQGKPRLVKFYDYQPVEKQQEIIRNIYGGMFQFPLRLFAYNRFSFSYDYVSDLFVIM